MSNTAEPIGPPTEEAPHHFVCECDYCYGKNGLARNGQPIEDNSLMSPSYYRFDMSDEEWRGE